MAASTGGPPAIRAILGALPADFSVPILVVQHIGPDFVEGFSRWLDGVVPPRVVLARHGELLQRGHVYVAPAGGCHLTVRDRRVRLDASEPVGGFRPSATTLFRSVAESHGTAALGVILTGMGRDGAEGLRVVRERGGRVIAQDRASSVVYSMPGEAVRAGLADEVLPLPEISGYLRRCAA